MGIWKVTMQKDSAGHLPIVNLVCVLSQQSAIRFHASYNVSYQTPKSRPIRVLDVSRVTWSPYGDRK